MKPLEKVHYLAIAVTLPNHNRDVLWAADPPNPWFLVFMFGAGVGMYWNNHRATPSGPLPIKLISFCLIKSPFSLTGLQPGVEQ